MKNLALILLTFTTIFNLFAQQKLVEKIPINALSEILVESQVSIMSLNIYGWKTMPQHSDDFAELIKKNNVDIVGIQEAVDDWKLTTKLPTDYSRANSLSESLGNCWVHQFQIFINKCAGVSFITSGRFDLTDGPRATRTGEYAVIQKFNHRYYVVNVHWDHESPRARLANAEETIEQLNKYNLYPKLLLGDFNSSCSGFAASKVRLKAKMTLLKDAGIDCLFVQGISGKATEINAVPSDHPSIVATLINTHTVVE